MLTARDDRREIESTRTTTTANSNQHSINRGNQHSTFDFKKGDKPFKKSQLMTYRRASDGMVDSIYDISF